MWRSSARALASGRVLFSLKAVVLAWLRLYAGEEDTYKVTLRIQNHILLNADKIPVEAGLHRFKEINKLLPWCPSQNHLPNTPEALPASRELTKFELCTVVLASMTRHIHMQYNASHGTTFACHLESLYRLLKLAVKTAQINCNLLNQYKSIANGKAGANSGGKGGYIPKKARFADKGDNEPGEVPHSDGKKKTECEHCAQWKPHVKNTRWTKDCKIFEADSTRKPRGGSGKCGGVRSQKSITMLLTRRKPSRKSLRIKRRSTRKAIASIVVVRAGTPLRPAAAAIPNRVMGLAVITKTLVIVILK